MDHGGGEGTTGLICAQDGVPTGLSCPDCRRPICPKCLVRTPVGLKCAACAPPAPALRLAGDHSRRRTAVVAAAIAVVAVGTWALLGRGGGGGAADEDPGVGATLVGQTSGNVVGTGRGGDGREWALQARIDAQGRICSRLTLTTGTDSREICDAVPTTRPFGPFRSRAALQGSAVTFQTWGIVSEQTARVQAFAEDGTTAEAQLLGVDAGLGARFFMSYADRLGLVTFRAYSADGQEIGRLDPPPIPPPPGR